MISILYIGTRKIKRMTMNKGINNSALLLEFYRQSASFAINKSSLCLEMEKVGGDYSEVELLFSEELTCNSEDCCFVNFKNDKLYEAKIKDDQRLISTFCGKEFKQVLSELLTCHKANLSAIIVVGSFARGVASESSDLDLIIISKKRIRPKELSCMHSTSQCDFISYSAEVFEKNIQLGNEFALWALKYGLVYFDRDFLQSLFPDHHVSCNAAFLAKIILLEKLFYQLRLSLYRQRSHIAKKKLDTIIKHMIRLELLKKDLLPKSSPELREQFLSISGSKLLLEEVDGLLCKADYDHAYQYLFKTFRVITENCLEPKGSILK